MVRDGKGDIALLKWIGDHSRCMSRQLMDSA